jgi:hypothetical protein
MLSAASASQSTTHTPSSAGVEISQTHCEKNDASLSLSPLVMRTTGSSACRCSIKWLDGWMDVSVCAIARIVLRRWSRPGRKHVQNRIVSFRLTHRLTSSHRRRISEGVCAPVATVDGEGATVRCLSFPRMASLYCTFCAGYRKSGRDMSQADMTVTRSLAIVLSSCSALSKAKQQ